MSIWKPILNIIYQGGNNGVHHVTVETMLNKLRVTNPQRDSRHQGSASGKDAVVRWRINAETGTVEVRFDTEDGDDDE